MATHHAHRSMYRRRGPASAAARQAMERAALALTDAVPGLVGDEALAERERIRQETERRDSAQRQLDEGGIRWV
ncbi:hypothetical protein ABB31_04325 [Stenotrophomonas pavanii]|nr:hypothetical protein ABB31_04325 [Stenotrophomonas pavanii]